MLAAQLLKSELSLLIILAYALRAKNASVEFARHPFEASLVARSNGLSALWIRFIVGALHLRRVVKSVLATSGD